MHDPTAALEARALPGLWRFGACTLDERVAELSLSGNPVALDRSGYEVLLALLRHAGEVVAKDELLEAGWPGRVVSENSLAKAIGRLRQALGADGESIRAVHGYGYRLATRVGFQPVPAEAVTAQAHLAAQVREGDRLPHRSDWRLSRRLGEGRAGAIFLATSDAGESRAVKLATSELGLRSLKREIALSRYITTVKDELPSVAPVLGWNLSQPPFFIELPFYPDGNLADWVLARGGLRNVEMATRLQLCARLCEAVAALHEIGIIHKDLKPENLYPVADADGGWRLVVSDLGAGGAAHSPWLAELGLTMSVAMDAEGVVHGGSMLYLAPEVIAGEMPTQRSDVFALGMLVYQLVSGDLRRSLAPGWEADIEDPLLRADIALAAAANPERRGLDARGFAERLRTLDARRAQLAEAARHEDAAERQAHRVALLSRRRRQLAAASTVLAVVLGVSLWQQHRTSLAWRQAEIAATDARTQEARARGVLAFLTESVLRQADPFSATGGEVSLAEAIDRAAGDVDTRFAALPGVAAEVHGTLGGTYEGMNRYAEAVKHYQRQVSLLEGATPVDQVAVAKARALLCPAQLWLGDLEGAIASCEQSSAEHLAAGLAPDRPEVFLAIADIRQLRARDALRRLAPRLERIRRSGDDDLYAFATWFAGIAQQQLGRIAEAERAYAQAVAARRRQLGDTSMQLAWVLSAHGKTLLMLGRPDEGVAELARSRAMFLRLGGPDHPHGLVPDVHLAANDLALGHWQAALDHARPAYETSLRVAGWQHWTIYAALYAIEAEAEQGNAAKARRLIAEFNAAIAPALEQESTYLSEAHWTGMAAASLALGDLDEAAGHIGRLHGLLRTQASEASPLLAARVQCLDARLQLAQGNALQARGSAMRCRARYLEAVPPESPYLQFPARVLAALPPA